MIPDPRFVGKPKMFWAHVRSISEQVGYTARGTGTVKVPSFQEILTAMEQVGLQGGHLGVAPDHPAPLASLLLDYFAFRAAVLQRFVEPRLMEAAAARALFRQLAAELKPRSEAIPWNKQKGSKRAPAYLTAIVNMLIRANAGTLPCDLNPRALTTITAGGKPLRTLARWVDGAFPGVVNPIAVWEIKEYYYTTTFGSRVADGVYESLLDGMELEELREHEGIDVKHYLIIDARYTWWECGKSYLCRIIDMLHMGYVDEVLFGREVVERIPVLVSAWMSIHQAKSRP